MAEIKSIAGEIVRTHTTEEVVAFLANQAKAIKTMTNEEDAKEALFQHYDGVMQIFSLVWALDEKLNGIKIATML